MRFVYAFVQCKQSKSWIPRGLQVINRNSEWSSRSLLNLVGTTLSLSSSTSKLYATKKINLTVTFTTPSPEKWRCLRHPLTPPYPSTGSHSGKLGYI